MTGHAQPGLDDYSVAFLAVAVVSLLASPACARLPPDAGNELSGRVSMTPAAVKTATADAGSVV